MKIIITGASGLLGRAVRMTCEAANHDVLPLSYSQRGDGLVPLNLLDGDAVKKTFADFRPDAVLHCAAERRPDVAEKDPAAAKQLNVEASRQLATIAKELNAVLVYVSTDYVFDGSSPPYSPEDTPNPLNLYGRTKLAGEQAVRETYPEGSIVLRVPVLYGEAPNPSDSAVNILLNPVRSDKETGMDDYAVRFPTCVDNVGRVLKDIAERYSRQDASSLPRILHFSSQTPYTKYTMAVIFAEILGVSSSHLISKPNAPGPDETPRPRDCHLSNDVLASTGIVTTEYKGFREWWTAYLQK